MTLRESTAPDISVVIPTRNRHSTLADCLERLAPGAQILDASKYEIIVSDDGDATATRALLEARFPWARLVAGPGRGPAANRNAGASAARGAWFAFTDDDTRPARDWLAAIAAASDGVDVVEGRTTCTEGLRSPREHAPVNETGGWWWSCNLAVTRELFSRLHGFDERFRIAHMEDVDFRERAKRAGATARFAEDAVIDHPPRRERWGTDWAPVHKAEFLFAAIHQRPLEFARTMVTVARVRARSVARAPLSADGVSAAFSALVELAQLAVCWGAWAARARATVAPPR